MLCITCLLPGSIVLPTNAEQPFDPVYYAVTYPDVVAVFGTDHQALLNHYLTYGINEGRLPYEGALPGTDIQGLSADTISKFDPAYYAAVYPDVFAVFGLNPQLLLNHYLTYGMKEGRIPYEGAAPGETVNGIAETQARTGAAVGFIPVSRLAHLSVFRKWMTNEELAQAYSVALQTVTPYVGLSREEQLQGIAVSLRERFDNNMTYSMTAPHYNDPYGYFILGEASCAGCARATGLCLDILGIPYEHVNEGQYTHQWCRINVNGVYWICDAYGLYCGPEPAPYAHPYFE